MGVPDAPSGGPPDDPESIPWDQAQAEPHHAHVTRPHPFLATNAPSAWPRVPSGEGLLGGHLGVDALTAHVAAYLHASGLDVVAAEHDVPVGAQTVRVDLVVRDGDREHPVFVFPAADVHREGTMFNVLTAVLAEAATFSGKPVYYAPRALPHVRAPTRADVVHAARRFEMRLTEAGEPASLDTGSVAEVVQGLRRVAGVPVERGGGDAVTGAAAFLGEWLRRRVGGEWMVRGDLTRTVLVIRAPGGSLQYELPLFAALPDTVRTGYDGLTELMGNVLRDVTHEAGTVHNDWTDIPVRPERYQPLVLTWLLGLPPDGGEQAGAVFRTCATCGDEMGEGCTFAAPARTMDVVFDRVVGLVNEPPIACACGSGDYREALAAYRIPDPSADGTVLVLSYFTESHSRIAVHRVRAP